jgi:general secretion pathway protein M
MTLQGRLDRLEPRERRLLGVLVGVFVLLVLLFIPAGFLTLLSSERADNDEIRDVINAIQDGREMVRKREAERQAILARYATPAPPLAALLEENAQKTDLEIPESQDRAVIPHGNEYEERSTKIVLRKVGMFNLVKLMESIAVSKYPLRISQLNIRKRGTGTDSYDVQMVVSAFDRKEKEKKEEAEEEDEDEDTESDSDQEEDAE